MTRNCRVHCIIHNQQSFFSETDPVRTGYACFGDRKRAVVIAVLVTCIVVIVAIAIGLGIYFGGRLSPLHFLAIKK